MTFDLNTEKEVYLPGETITFNGQITSHDEAVNYEQSITGMLHRPDGSLSIINFERMSCAEAACEVPVCPVDAVCEPYYCQPEKACFYKATYTIPYDAKYGDYYLEAVGKVGYPTLTRRVNFNVAPPVNSYVDVTIEPKNQVTSFGQEVVYHVTVQDNHPPCKSIDHAHMENEYKITVSGLPFGPEYPKRIFLRPGESKSFTVRILPDPTEVGLPHPEQYLQDFDFKVKAKIVNGNHDEVGKDTAVLTVVFNPPAPPRPPLETANIHLYQGWNLINLPGNGDIQHGSCGMEDPIIFLYSHEEKQYFTLDEAKNHFGESWAMERMMESSFWVYSFEQCDLRYRGEFASYSDLEVNKGWNLLPTTKDMVGKTLHQISGTADFSHVYRWHAPTQQWTQMGSHGTITEDYLFQGILAKSRNRGNLDISPPYLQPPDFPHVKNK